MPAVRLRGRATKLTFFGAMALLAKVSLRRPSGEPDGHQKLLVDSGHRERQ